MLTTTDRNDLGIIVLAGKSGSIVIPGQCGTNSFYFISGNLLAITRTA